MKFFENIYFQYAQGASGNASTEDVVYMLHGYGVKTGIDLGDLVNAGKYICEELGRESESKVTRAMRNSIPKTTCKQK